MERRGASIPIILTMIAGISACSLFRRETPQQKLFDALNHGNAPAASQIWLTMSPEDRVKFNRGEGITPVVPPAQAINMLTQMDPDEMHGQITITPPGSGGTLLNLPALAAPQLSAPPAEP
jgi:hypothetical protein